MRLSTLHTLLGAAVALAVTACASIGRPEGGPRDETPPVYVSSNPAMGATNVDKNKIELIFNENVQLQDAATKIVVSPPQKSQARAYGNGRKVTVELKDTLLPNTTYTIDFGDAIKDLNEGNILDGFTSYFSTGDIVDTLCISGIVLEARSLEPAQGLLVGVYSDLADSAITTLQMERIARTNQFGQFAVQNLKPGNYRVFAINDVDRDYKWNRSEDVAFYDSIVSPYAKQIQVADTLRSATNEDSIVYRDGVAYFPNDILLTWFNEDYKKQGRPDTSRPDRRRIIVNRSAPDDTLPQITIAEGRFAGRNIDDWAILRKNANLDSLEYWIKDSLVYNIDSLKLAVKYHYTVDSIDALTWRSDTLRFFYSDPKVNVKKKKDSDEEADSLAPKIEFMKFIPITQTSHEVYMPLLFKADQPLDSIDANAVHLEIQQDTLWLPVKNNGFVPDSIDPVLVRRLDNKWLYGRKYRLTIDSAAIVGIYGNHTEPIKHEFTIKKEEDYANLTLNITPHSETLHMMVEILDKSDKPIRVGRVVNGAAVFTNMAPGEYYARLYIDANNNGKWDTGNIANWIQPEEVYYYPKKINLRKNWDAVQSWDIYDKAIDTQKPYAIKKNKPKLKQGEQQPVDEDEDEFDDTNNMFGTTNNQYGSARRNNLKSNSRR